MGACICIPSDEERLNDLAGAISAYKADWIFLTPTTAKLLNPDDVPCLRTLVIGGEASPPQLIKLWSSVENLELLNGYGPTETVVFATCYRFSPSSKVTTLGRGIGTRCWVVNFEEERHCRIDEVGELLIESPAMARGYLDDDEKTRKAFIDPPTWLKWMGVESRLYRTGDLVA